MQNKPRPGWLALVLPLGAVLMTPARANAEVEITPMVGIGEPSGEAGDTLGSGLMVALSVGARVSTLLSLQAQLEYDRLNFKDSVRDDQHGHVARLVFSPAFHLVRDKLDFSLGPTLGIWRFSANYEILNQDGSFTVRGTELGVRAAMMIAASPTVSVGPTFGYAATWASKACNRFGNANEVCSDDLDDEADGFWSLAFAARF